MIVCFSVPTCEKWLMFACERCGQWSWSIGCQWASYNLIPIGTSHTRLKTLKHASIFHNVLLIRDHFWQSLFRLSIRIAFFTSVGSGSFWDAGLSLIIHDIKSQTNGRCLAPPPVLYIRVHLQLSPGTGWFSFVSYPSVTFGCSFKLSNFRTSLSK